MCNTSCSYCSRSMLDKNNKIRRCYFRTSLSLPNIEDRITVSTALKKLFPKSANKFDERNTAFPLCRTCFTALCATYKQVIKFENLLDKNGGIYLLVNGVDVAVAVPQKTTLHRFIGISSVENTVCKEEKIAEASSSNQNATEPNCLTEDDSFLYPDVVINGGFDPLSEETDPLMQPENVEDNANNHELEKIQESKFVEIEQIKLEPEFLPETSDVDLIAFTINGNNEHCEPAISPTYIIPQIVEEENLNSNFLKKTHNEIFMCKFCGKIFRSNSDLKEHEMIHTEEKPYKCKTCGLAFSNSKSLIQHRQCHTGERGFKCSFCETAFITSSELSRHHRKSHHTENTPNKLNEDKEIHTEKMAHNYTCHTCGDIFSDNNALIQHLRSHTGAEGEKAYKCSVCEKSFKYNNSLKVHEKIHTGEKPFKCEICGKAFCVSNSLIEHQRRHAGEKRFKCTFCGKAFITSSALTVHIKRHTGEKPHLCNFCEKSFITLSHLKRHALTHTGEKPYKCRFCEKRHLIPQDRTHHERTHTGERPFQCDICEHASFSSSALSQHKKDVHNGVKPHRCDICGKDFKRTSLLIVHKRRHTAEKPYKCKFCEKAFYSSNELKVHASRHTAEKPHKCKLCEKGFYSSYELKVHLRRTHAERRKV